jgi:hypothetical protein
VRGGLDDALDKLARRDELRRRAAGEATGTPPAVQELVEAIAAVVGRNPKLEVTVGVEGAGDPTLLHFFVEDGTVQVNADSSVASRVTEAVPTSPRHADFDIELEEPVEEPYVAPAAYPASTAYPSEPESGQSTRRISYDDRDRYDPGTGYDGSGYTEPDPYVRPDTYASAAGTDRPYDGQRRYDEARNGSARANHVSPNGRESRESAFPIGDTAAPGNPFLHPFAATPPPPVPPQTTRRIRPEQHRASEEPSAAERSAGRSTEVPGPRPAEPQRGMPTPLPEPIPLKVDTEETEMAAKRLAALLRDNPSLLRQAPPE